MSETEMPTFERPSDTPYEVPGDTWTEVDRTNSGKIPDSPTIPDPPPPPPDSTKS